MKLRIRGNSIRLRLGQSEVRRLRSESLIEEITSFGPSPQNRLTVSLRTALNISAPSAAFENGHITVRVPADVVRQWASTDQIGIDAFQPLGDGSTLKILIEKDFECIDAPTTTSQTESQEDAFPRGTGILPVCIPEESACKS